MVWRTDEIRAVFRGYKHECPVIELNVTKLCCCGIVGQLLVFCCCRIVGQLLVLKQGVMQSQSLAVTHGVSSAQLLVNDKLKLMSLRLICHESQSSDNSFCLFCTCQRNTCTFTYLHGPSP